MFVVVFIVLALVLSLFRDSRDRVPAADDAAADTTTELSDPIGVGCYSTARAAARPTLYDFHPGVTNGGTSGGTAGVDVEYEHAVTRNPAYHNTAPHGNQ
jgi:hypothetical protein